MHNALEQRIRGVCDYIRSHPDDQLQLADLADRASLSRFHFQRSFKAVVGLTPRQFVEASRLEKLKGQLRATQGQPACFRDSNGPAVNPTSARKQVGCPAARPSVTDAIYDAGFGSSSRVYERVDTRLGMTPAQYRGGGKDVAITYVSADSALGRMMIGATDRGLCFVQFAGRDEDLLALLRAEYPAARLEPMREPHPQPFESWMTALRGHLAGQQPRLDLPLDLRATAFQMKVWRYLQSIPYGSVQSYSEVAAAVGQPQAARAVARACASNRVALVIPCHRVIRGTGELGGYRWGLDRKRALIDQERVGQAHGLTGRVREADHPPSKAQGGPLVYA
jgi:AraC family transcriptional regulator of adaptative response/methylated-DNA-[protein]-cysteine methyltransferase